MAGEKILIINYDLKEQEELAKVLKDDGFAVDTAEDGGTGLKLVNNGGFDVVLTDMHMVGVDGVEVLETVKRTNPDTEVIMMTGFVTPEKVVETMKLGAFDYLIRPFESYEEALKSVSRALQKKRLTVMNRRLANRLLEANKNLSSTGGELREAQTQLNEDIKIMTEVRGRVEAVLHGITDGVIVVDSEFNIIMINPIMERWFGINEGSVMGVSLTDALSHEGLDSLVAEAAEGKGDVVRTEFSHPASEDNQEKILEANSRIIHDDAGGVIGILTVLRDVTVEREWNRELENKVTQRTQELKESNDQLERKVMELSTINKVSRAMSSVFDTKDLLNIIINSATTELEAQMGWILLLDEDKGLLSLGASKGIDARDILDSNLGLEDGIAGWAIKSKEAVNITNIDLDPQFKGLALPFEQAAKSLICVPIMAKDRVIGVLNVGNGSPEGRFNRDDPELISTLANEMGLAIENALLYRKLTVQERMQRELEIASSIQKSLLPQEMPEIKNTDLAVISVPAREVGGDYYDFVKVGQDQWGIVVGDVSGKSVPAAIYMAMVRSILRAQATVKTSASDVLGGVNSLVAEDAKTIGNTMFVTMFYGVLDPSSRTFVYSNAGHNSPILYRPREKKYGLLKTGGMVVGVVGDYQYQQSKIQLEAGDTIVFYTDGISEAKNPKGDMLGDDTIRKMITRYGDLGANEIRDRIYEHLVNFTNGEPQHDDQTLVVLKS